MVTHATKLPHPMGRRNSSKRCSFNFLNYGYKSCDYLTFVNIPITFMVFFIPFYMLVILLCCIRNVVSTCSLSAGLTFELY